MEPSSAVDWMATAVESSRELDDFESVVRLHWLRVFRFALASLRDRHAAESLAQDCFLKAYRARESFRGEASVGTWLMQIAVNLVRDRVRDRRWQFWRRARQTAVDATAAASWIRDAGATPEDLIGVLRAISPQVGGPKTVAAAPELMVALGLSLPEDV